MSKTTYPKLQYHLVCDDIRREVGNKSSLIGIYRRDIVVATTPYIFPKLCFHLAFKNVRGKDTLKLQLLNPDDKEILKPKPATVKIPENKKLSDLVVEIEFIGIKITKEGVHRLVYAFGEGDKAKGEIKIAIKTQR